ncbi:peptide ABC transporter substrate-binding protein [Puniceicoccales bacterium CK1056]|uniref:Peptide ABC transporter substrate-binding protein n=1 Tax=Oceanipulchritudo coccoides TaxID=2706888 RepID=A0A6B2LY15_9BACT|nr:peptide ABC transporter substrate-binding protein [Oceanipulchritudo coccoides]NDV60946.1 peptide ABC transporter substrate-binding protein [Oceanipulchritudo coccoides]
MQSSFALIINRLGQLACIGLGGVFLAGCGAGIPNADEGVEQGILLFGNGAEPKTLDPQRATGVTENKIISVLLEGLIAYHPTDDNLPEPGVAERWEANEDASTWTFFLREDALWSNGDPVTAQDFVFSYERMLNPDFPGEYSQMLYVLKNGEAYKNGEVSDFNEVGVVAVDDKTLRIELVGPTPYFLSMLKHYSWFPVHPATIEAHGGPFDMSGTWTLPGNYVGNGAFVLDTWLPNQYLRVVKSPTYWDRERMQLNEVYFFPVEDDNTEKRMFDSGLLHVTGTVPTNDIPILRKTKPDLIHIDDYLGTYFYRLNVEREPLDNPLVRKALNYAIDRQAIVDKVSLGDQKPSKAYVPAGFKGFSAPDVLSYDPERARGYLAEAGYPGGEGFPDLYLLFNTSEGHRKIAEAVVAMWNKNLGINMQLENKEWKVYLDAQSHLDYDISRSGWIGDYMDPITFLEMFTTGNGNNDTGWGNDRYDSLINAAFRSKTEEEHFTSLMEAEAILLEELPIVPLYSYTRIYLMDPRLKGWSPKLLDNRPFKYLYLSE